MGLNDLTVVGKGSDNTSYNLTKGQEFAALNIIDFVGKPFDPTKYIVGLTGPGGVGKTYTLKFIINKCKYSLSVIKCATPTHKANRVLSEAISKEVDTIQSVFGLRLDMRLEDFNPSRPQFNPMSKAKLDNIKLLVIDEGSMLPAKLVTYICNKCKELEIKVIFVGDPFQLSPPGESRSIAFDRCYIVYNLTEIVRQDINNPVTPLLQLLRNDIQNKTYKFLEYISKRVGGYQYNEIGEGFSILSPHDFKANVDSSFSDENYTKNIDMYRIIAYTNPCVTEWNSYIRNTIITDAHKNIITKNDLVMSYETIVDEFMQPIINNSEEYIINDILNFVDETHKFKGFLVRFQLVHGGHITRPLFVIDHRDRGTVMAYHTIVNSLVSAAKTANGGTRVSKWKEYYAFKKKYLIAANIVDRSGIVLHSRDIDYGFSLTAHKSQGSTYNSVFVDVNNMVYNKHGQPHNNQDDLLRRLYVGCSRAKKQLILCYGR